jgi:MFS family permease
MALTDRLGPLRTRDFRNLYAGQAVSVMGDGLLLVAVAFAVIEIGGGAAEIGLVLGANALSLVVFALIGGVWADRLPRHRVMLAADGIRLAVQAIGAALLLADRAEVWHLAVLLTIYGAAEAFFRPAATGLVPHTVAPEHLQQANALLGLTGSAGMVVGPAIGGVLVAVSGPGGAFAFDAATFAVSAFFLLRVRGVAAAVPRHARRAFTSELAEGLREVRRQSWLWWTILIASLWLLFSLAPLFVLGPLVADAELSGASSWAVIVGAYGVGGVVGGLWALRLRPRRPLVFASALFALEALLPALLAVVPSVGVLAAAAFLGGISYGVFEAMWSTALQQHVPDATLARVSSLDWMGSLALLPIGYIIAGPVAEIVGADAVLWVAAASGIVGSAALCFHPGVRGVRRRVVPLEA